MAPPVTELQRHYLLNVKLDSIAKYDDKKNINKYCLLE